MIVELNSNLFTNIENLQEVNQLLGIFSDRRRYDYFCEYTEIADTELYQSLLSFDKDLIVEYFNRFIQENPTINYLVSEETSDTEFNILEAKLFFNQPLTIFLENSFNDGRFIDSICEAFRKKGKIIRRHKKEVWIENGNTGGAGNIINTINDKKNNYDALPKAGEKYLRCIVIVDSDKKYLTDTTHNKNKLTTFLKNNNIPYHIFEKREIENYMPDEIISNIEHDKEYFKAFLNLTPVQKDFFDIQKGFGNIPHNKLPERISEFFSGISDDDYKILRNGVSDKDSFKSEYPQLFEGATQQQLKGRTAHQENPNELEHILKAITELL